MNKQFCFRFAWPLVCCAVFWPARTTWSQDQSSYEQQLAKLMPGIAHQQIAQRQSSQQAWEKLCFEAGAKNRETDRVSICIAMTKQLGDEVPVHARVFMLRQLERVGGEESVEAIAELIHADDPLVRDGAIRALSANPHQSAGSALLMALQKTEDRPLALSLIKGLGYRGDPQCVECLVTYCTGPSLAHCEAALATLARIEAPGAEAAIRQFIEEDPRPEQFEPFALAYMVVADRLYRRGDTKTAAEMYRTLADEPFTGPVRIAVAQGRLKTVAESDESPVRLLEQYLTGDDQKIRQVAAAHVRQLDDAPIKQIFERMAGYPEVAQLDLLRAIGSSRNRAALAGVMNAIQSDDVDVRIAALSALAGVGDDSTVAVLISKMLEGGTEGDAAADSLERLFAPGVDGRVVEAMRVAEDSQRRIRLIQILERRRATSAIDAIIQEARHPDPTVRQVAVGVCSRLAAESDISKMIATWQTTSDRGERDEIEKAIVAVCRRIPNQESQAAPVLAVYHRANAETQTKLLPLLGRIGGDQVLQLVRTEMEGGLKGERFVAHVQALANWPDAKVTNDLMRVSTHEDPSVRIRSVRALARIVVLPDERTDQQRLDLLKQTMEKAERDEERTLILDRAKAIRTMETLRFVVPFLEIDELRDRAGRTIVDLAHHRGLREPNQDEFDDALRKVIAVIDDEGLVNRAKGYMKQ